MLADRPRWVSYLATAGLIAVAAVVKAVVDACLHINTHFAFNMVAIAIVAWAFGRGPGWFAVLFAGVCYDFYFMLPRFRLGSATTEQLLQLLVFMLAAGCIVEVLRFAVRTRHQARLFSREAQRLSLLAEQMQTRMQAALGSLTEPFGILTAVRDKSDQIVDFRMEYVNQAGINAIKVGRPNVSNPNGMLLSEFSPFARPLGVFEAYVRTVLTSQPYHDEVCFRLEENGSERWTEIHAAKLEDGLVVQWRDATVRRQTEDAILRNEKRYRSLVQATSAIVWRANATGEFVDVQPQWAAFTGQSAAQYQHKGWIAAIHPDDRERFRKAWDQAIGKHWLIEQTLRVRRFDGDYRDMLLRAVPMLDESGRATEWIGTYTDITERVRAEEALRKSETRFRRLYDSNQIGVVFYHADGTLSDPNDAFLRMLGRARDAYETEGLNFKALTPPGWEEADRANWEELASKGACGPFEKEFLRADGTRVPVLITGANLDQGSYEHGVACVVDLSQIKQVEAQLRESQTSLLAVTESLERRIIERTAEAEQRSQQLRALALDLAETESRERKRLAKLLHDHFQQLISAAKLKAGLVRRGLADQKLIESQRQVESLLEEAIAASRSLATELSPPVLSDGGLLPALEWISRKMERDYGMHVSLSCDAEAEPESEQIRTLMFECVRELLFNIVKHAATKEATLTANLSAEGLLQLIVEDKGKGFDVQYAMRRNSAAGEDGSFGLFSIRERLSLIGGLLNIRSKLNEGTRVELTVPVGARKRPLVSEGNGVAAVLSAECAVKGDHAGIAGRNVGQYDAANPARVLVADDHRLFREGLINLLTQEPAIKIVGEAADGQEAVDLCSKLLPDIVICDVSMPKLNGVQVTKQITRNCPETRVIGLSMHEREDMADAMRAAGAVAYVTKSGPSDQLLSVLRQVTLNQPLESI